MERILDFINEYFMHKFGIKLTPSQIANLSCHTFPEELAPSLIVLLPFLSLLSLKPIFRLNKKNTHKVKRIQKLFKQEYGVTTIVGAIITVRAYTFFCEARQLKSYRAFREYILTWFTELVQGIEGKDKANL